MTELETAFLKVIRDTPRDTAVRKVYADWLDENDRPEEADFVRAWTRDKHDEAVAWMSRFAIDMMREDWAEELEHVDIGNLIKAGWGHVKDGAYVCLVGSGFWAEEQLEDDKTRNRFWWCWSTITGKPFTPDDPDKPARDGHLFICCG